MPENLKPFLTAEWRYLAMLNYEIDPAVLAPYVPAGTELDSFAGKTYVSIVGFLFRKTKVMGVPVPFHRNFEEINLRFYVKRNALDGVRRGVVFIKEIVPKAIIAHVARKYYNEPYVSRSMRHSVERDEQTTAMKVDYGWYEHHPDFSYLTVNVRGAAALPAAGSIEEFITEHYWGYTTQKDGSTMEYRVEHPQWRIWNAKHCHLDCYVDLTYGPQFFPTLSKKPTSALLAEGSPVTVYRGVKI